MNRLKTAALIACLGCVLSVSAQTQNQGQKITIEDLKAAEQVKTNLLRDDQQLLRLVRESASVTLMGANLPADIIKVMTEKGKSADQVIITSEAQANRPELRAAANAGVQVALLPQLTENLGIMIAGDVVVENGYLIGQKGKTTFTRARLQASSTAGSLRQLLTYKVQGRNVVKWLR